MPILKNNHVVIFDNFRIVLCILMLRKDDYPMVSELSKNRLLHLGIFIQGSHSISCQGRFDPSPYFLALTFFGNRNMVEIGI